MSEATNRIPTLLGFGAVCLAGAALLAWLSSVTTLTLSRTETAATLAFETRLFNLRVIDRRSFPDVTGAFLIRSRGPGQRSNTPDYLMFQSKHGQIDAGYAQQHFWRDYSALDDFLTPESWPPPQELRLSSIERGEEFRRFLFAHAAAAFLAQLGLGVWWLAVREVIGRRRAVGL